MQTPGAEKKPEKRGPTPWVCRRRPNDLATPNRPRNSIHQRGKGPLAALESTASALPACQAGGLRRGFSDPFWQARGSFGLSDGFKPHPRAPISKGAENPRPVPIRPLRPTDGGGKEQSASKKRKPGRIAISDNAVRAFESSVLLFFPNRRMEEHQNGEQLQTPRQHQNAQRQLGQGTVG